MSLTILGPPSAQSPFACHKRYLLQGGVLHHLEGRYPCFLALTGSCVRPNSSARTSCSALISSGLCRLLPAPAGRRPFPTLSLRVFPQVPGSLSRWSCAVLLPVSSRTLSAFPKMQQQVGSPHRSAQRLPGGGCFRDSHHSLRSGPRVCLPPRSLPPLWLKLSASRAAVAFTSEQNTCRYLHAHRIC